jgi:hypothetical protein
MTEYGDRRGRVIPDPDVPCPVVAGTPPRGRGVIQMARTKAYWSHIGNELGDTQRRVIEIAEQLGLKYLVSESNDTSIDLCVSVPDGKLEEFVVEVNEDELYPDHDVACENEIQRSYVSAYLCSAIIDPEMKLEEWEALEATP